MRIIMMRTVVCGVWAALLLASAMARSLAAAGPQVQSSEAAARDVAAPLEALVRADWIAQDQRFQAAEGIKESFSLAHTRRIIQRAGRTCGRLRRH